MAITLKLTVSDGSESDVDLVDALYGGVTKYQPVAPEAGAVSVTETAEVDVRPGGTDAPRTKINMINRMFALARARAASKTGPRVFVLCETSSLNTPYRSEILDGKVSLTDEVFGVDVASNWYQLVIAWTRAPFWERNTELQLALDNGNGTNNTSGLTLQNNDTASGDCWFTVPTTQLPSNTSGDIDAPLRLEITNTTNVGVSALNAKTFYIGIIKSNSYASNRVPVLEGESGSGGAGVTKVNNAGTYSSNGNHATCQWYVTSIVTLVSWTLAAADLQRMRGMRFIPMLRLGSALGSADYDFGWQVLLAGVTQLNPIKWVRAGAADQLIPLGSGELPPYLSDASNLAALTFVLKARRITGGSNAADIDAIQFMPCDPQFGGFRTLTPVGYGLAYNAKLIDDNIARQVYVDETATGGGIWGHYLDDGDPITIRPNCTNQVYILHSDMSAVPDARRTISVKAYIRPRRSTL